MPRAAIATLGCKVNKYDSMVIAQSLKEKDYRLVPFKEKAEVYIINTCTVTQSTDYQSRQLIRKASSLNPSAQIVVTGCYAQGFPEKIEGISGVSYIVGTEYKEKIVHLLQNPSFSPKPQVLVSEGRKRGELKEPPLESFGNQTRAFLKVQEGCNSFCSYCIVPYVRGVSRSLKKEEVLSRLNRLSQTGYKEVVLSGTHLGQYGVEQRPALTLLDLLQFIEERALINRIRLSSLNPGEISPPLIDFLSSSKLVLNHLHLSLQSGDDEILKGMNRRYKARLFQELVINLVEKIPELAIGVDVIVGFPGEGKKEFLNTYNLLEILPLSYFHVFPYSLRPGTLAATFSSQVERKVVKKGAEVLRNLGKRKRQEFYLKFLGKELSILIEGKRDRETGKLKGLSRNYIPILIEGENNLFNQEIKVRVTEIKEGKVLAQHV